MNEKEKVTTELSELLTAEVRYLRVRGWQPFGIGETAPVKIMWKRTTALKEQDDAVLQQKREDRKLLEH